MTGRALLTEQVLDSAGNVQAGTAVTLYEVDGSTPLAQTLYAAATGVATLTNPLTTDTSGRVQAYALTAQRVVAKVGSVSYLTEFRGDPVDYVIAASPTLTTPTLVGPGVDVASFTEQAGPPATPDASHTKLYVGTDNHLRLLSSGGTPILLLEAGQAAIVDADVAAGAAIALAKLAAGSTGLLRSNGVVITAGNQLALADIPNALITLAKLTQGADGQVLAAPGGVNTWTPSPTITGAVTVGSLIPGAAPGGTPAQHALYSKNVPKAWVRFAAASASILDSFNVSSVSRSGVGTYVVAWSRVFSSANYAVVVTAESASSIFARLNGVIAAQVGILTATSSTGAAADADYIDVAAFGVQ